LQDASYSKSEESLKEQIASVKEQVNTLQAQLLQSTEQKQEAEKQQQEQDLQQRLTEIQTIMGQLEEQIIQVEYELATFYPVPEPTSTPASRFSATATPVPTATLSPERFVDLKELEKRQDQLETLRDLYKKTYASLVVLGNNDTTSEEDSRQRQDQLQTTLALYQQIYTNLLNSYEAVNLARERNTPNVTQVERAPVPTVPVQPQPVRNAMLGSVIGLFMMAAVAFLVEYLDDTIKTPEDVSRHLSLSVIGMIGEMGHLKGKKDAGNRVYLAENPLSPIAEAFRTLRTNIDFASVDQPVKTLLITSAGPSEGKSNLGVNLAVVMAQGDKKVILLDADLRRPTVHRYLQITNRRGLTDLFRDQVRLANVINSWGDPQIAVITSGGLPPNPSELLGSERMGRILDELKEKSDIIIIDSPPCIVADPVVLSAKVDGVILVVEPGKTRIGAIQVVMEQLHRAGARIIGVVLNPITKRRSQYYSKYHYYSSYYSRSYGRYYFSDDGANKHRKNGRPKKDETRVEKQAKQP